MFISKKIRTVAWAFFSFMVFTGTYNAIVINSDSKIAGNEVKFVKRLDEIYGVTERGRLVANTMSWQKITPQKIEVKKVQVTQQFYPSTQVENKAPSVIEELVPVAAVQEELSLSLVEVINPKKWPTALTTAQFNGNLSTSNGVIEDLSVSLPNEEGVSVSFSEMTGNVFEYDYNGELYSGMMYQVDQNSYMVTLTNGPLEGTRLRFAGQSQSEPQEPQEALAQTDSNEQTPYQETPIASTNFEDTAANQQDQQMQQEALEAQNLQQQQPPQEAL